MVGPRQPPVVDAMAHAMNDLLGNANKTVFYVEPVLNDRENGPSALSALVDEMRAGAVDTLIMGAFDPAYAAPIDLDFAAHLSRVDASVYHGLYRDRTASEARWFIPRAHELETWGDERGIDGTVTLAQPLIEPLFGGIAISEILVSFLKEGGTSAETILKDFWRGRTKGSAFDSFWQDALQRGTVSGTVASAVTPTLAFAAVAEALRGRGARRRGEEIELNFQEDLTIQDGRFGDNGWLMELPDPITKVTWDNTATVSPSTAQALGVETESVVTLRLSGRTVRAPIYVVPTQADRTVCVNLGYGRTHASSTAQNVGFDAYQLRTTQAPWFEGGLAVIRTAERHRLAITQPQPTQAGRALALTTTLGELQRDPGMSESGNTLCRRSTSRRCPGTSTGGP